MHTGIHPIADSLFERLRRDSEIMTIVEKADVALRAFGYTDHGRRHVVLVATNAAKLLAALGYDAQTCDLAAVCGLLHDIGNLAGRNNHAAAGALLAYQLLIARNVSPAAAADVMAAIGNHDESEHGVPVNAPGAALIIADKADIHRSRVRVPRPEEFDMHDKANYAVTKAELDLAPREKQIALRLTVDTSIDNAEGIAELFALRFAMSDDAARFLGCTYEVSINGTSIR